MYHGKVITLSLQRVNQNANLVHIFLIYSY